MFLIKNFENTNEVYRINKKLDIKIFIIIYLIMCVIGYLFYKSILLSMIFGFLGFFLRPTFKREIIKRKKRQVALEFKDALYFISSSLSSGRQMDQALRDSYDNLKLIYPENSIMVGQFKKIILGMKFRRDSDEQLLQNMANSLEIEDINNFVDIYITCKKRGGDLKSVIDKSSKKLMDKMELDKEITSIMVEKKFEGKIVAAMPILVILGLNVFSPDYLEPLYTTLMGRIIMTFSLFFMILSFKLSLKIMDMEV